MKKTLAMSLSCLLLTGLFSACSTAKVDSSSSSVASTTSASSSASSEVKKPDKPAEIVMWTKDRHDQDFMTSVIDKFNKEHDGYIHVNYEIYSDNYAQTIDIAASTNELPDLLCTTTNNIASLYQDKLADLTPYMDEDYKERFGGDSAFVEGINKFGNKIVTMPCTGTTLRLVYNQDIFNKVGIKAPPATLDELVEDAQLISEQLSREGVYGFALPMKNPSNGLGRGFPWITTLSGATVFNGFDYTTGSYDFTPYKASVEAFAKIFTSKAAFPGCESLEIDPLRTQFANGKIGMYMTYNHSEWGVYTNQFPTDVKWQYAPLPSADGKVTGSQSLTAGGWYAISDQSKNKDAAWEVMKAIYSDEVLAEYHSQGLGVVVVPSALKKATPPESIEKVPYIAIQATDKIWPPAPIGVTPEGNDWGKAFADIIFGNRPVSDFDAVAADLAQRYNAAYDQGIAEGKTSKTIYPKFSASDPAGTAK